MHLIDILEDHSFVASTQAMSYLDLLMKSLVGSSRAITKYLDTPEEQHNSLRQSVVRVLKANDQDAYSEMYDIVDVLKADGHAGSINDVRNVRVFFQVVDQAIRAKRD